jgi:hypothetical protein
VGVSQIFVLIIDADVDPMKVTFSLPCPVSRKSLARGTTACHKHTCRCCMASIVHPTVTVADTTEAHPVVPLLALSVHAPLSPPQTPFASALASDHAVSGIVTACLAPALKLDTLSNPTRLLSGVPPWPALGAAAKSSTECPASRVPSLVTSMLTFTWPRPLRLNILGKNRRHLGKSQPERPPPRTDAAAALARTDVT